MRRLLWVLVLAIFVFLIYWLSTNMEKYETQVWSGASSEARKNPYLAAEQFLQGRNVTVFSASEALNFDDISTNDIVFLSHVDSMLVSQSQIDKALSWISRGGYLLVGVSDEIEGRSSILKEFDISPVKRDVKIEEAFTDDDGEVLSPSERLREINRQIEEEIAKESSAEKTVKKEPNPKSKIDADDDFAEQLLGLINLESDYEYYRIDLSSMEDQLFLAVLDRITFEHEMLYAGEINSDEVSISDEVYEQEADYQLSTWVGDEHGARLIQFYYGEGTFTVLSSTEIWENDYIGLADHAYFLSYIVPDESTLHLFYNITAPTLTELVKRYFIELMLASLVLLGLWLWRNGVRVQPITKVVEGQRRSFAEHLGASAKFLVAKQQYHVLLEPLKDDIEYQMRPFYPNYSQLNGQAQIALLAERTQLNETILQSWIGYIQRMDTQEELLAALKIGNVIRKKL